MRDLLRDKVFKPGYRARVSDWHLSEEKCALEDPSMVFIITRLMHIVNVLQHKAQFLQPEGGISLEMQRYYWQDWVTTGVPPSQRPTKQQLDPRHAEPGQQDVAIAGVPSTEHRPFDNRGPQRWGSAVLAQAIKLDEILPPTMVAMSEVMEPVTAEAVEPAARRHVLDLLSGKIPGNRYCIWLAKEARDPLLAIPIRRWTNYAPDLFEIFRSEPWPNPLKDLADFDLTVFRFIAYVVPAITGETLKPSAVSTELLEEGGRWRKRKRVV
jgi:hypothetical protein